MRKSLPIVVALVASFFLGLLASGPIGGLRAGATDSRVDIPATALKMWFPPVSEFENGGKPLGDERFDALLATLDEAMTSKETLADLERSIHPNVQGFYRRIAIPELTEAQKEKASAYLAELRERHPEHGENIDRHAGLLDMYAGAYPVVPAFVPAVRPSVYSEAIAIDGEAFTDAQIDGMLTALDGLLQLPEVVDDFDREARHQFRTFNQLLQRGRVGDEQTARILARFDAFESEHPDLGEMIDERRHYVQHLLPGRVAQTIAGKDTEGVEFSLEEYRGNIVVLVFSGEWCGPCRGEYPYHRFVLEQFKDDPVVLLGVNSDADVETIREAKVRERLPYRTWWDGHGQEESGSVAATKGPIATAWEVFGWPSIFVLDREGVIRHVNPRRGALIKVLDEMVVDIRRAEFDAARAAEAAEAREAAEAQETEQGQEAGAHSRLSGPP